MEEFDDDATEKDVSFYLKVRTPEELAQIEVPSEEEIRAAFQKSVDDYRKAVSKYPSGKSSGLRYR